MSEKQPLAVIEGTFIFLYPDGMNNYEPLLIKLHYNYSHHQTILLRHLIVYSFRLLGISV